MKQKDMKNKKWEQGWRSDFLLKHSVLNSELDERMGRKSRKE